MGLQFDAWSGSPLEVGGDAWKPWRTVNGPMPERFLTTEEVADLLRTSPETVRHWRKVKKGPDSFKVGRRVLYAREDVETFISRTREKGQRDE